jgi:hypothetical protein
MAQTYIPVEEYIVMARSLLQDMVAPYRYADTDIVSALNIALSEMGRIRPDIFLDLKYQSPLVKGDIGDGVPPSFVATDTTSMVPVPGKYVTTLYWFTTGWLQMFDMADTQDQRAQGFMAKFQQHLLMLNAA